MVRHTAHLVETEFDDGAVEYHVGLLPHSTIDEDVKQWIQQVETERSESVKERRIVPPDERRLYVGQDDFDGAVSITTARRTCASLQDRPETNGSHTATGFRQPSDC